MTDLWIGGRLPGLNELLAGKSTQKQGWNAYNDVKQRWFGQIKLRCLEQHVQPVGPAYFSFLFVEPDRRRDPDNVSGGGIKLIFDSLVGAEVMKGDSWAHVLGFVSYWQVGAAPGCLVHADEHKIWSKESMEALLAVKTEKSV